MHSAHSFGLRVCALAALANLGLTVGWAWAQGRSVPGMRQAEVHNPFSPRGMPNTATKSPAETTPPSNDNGNGGNGTGNGNVPNCPPMMWSNRPGIAIGYGYLNNGLSYGYNPYGYYPYGYGTGGYGYPYNYGYSNNWTSYQAMLPSAVVSDSGASDPVDVANDLTDLNDRRNELAARYIEFGDKQFAQGRYGEAQLRYRKAIEAAPAQALGYLRRAQALIAVGKFEAAADSLEQGLRLDPDFVKSRFRLQALYLDQGDDLTQHTERLRQATIASPDNADLALLLGWQLYFSGNKAAAHEEIARALANGGRADSLHTLFAATEPDKAAADKQAAEQPAPAKRVQPAGRAAPASPPASNAAADPGIDI
ncbi:MAG: tetratricopeptide repeat protein [Pirellulales bacterium]|nr:tetratricopeptide repeat protein [Pirellulales bacterium]